MPACPAVRATILRASNRRIVGRAGLPRRISLAAMPVHKR